MKIKIIVARTAYPTVGQIIEPSELLAKELVDSGIAEYVDTKPEKTIRPRTDSK